MLAVVGHTNAGKTSLLRTLVRRKNFGEVSDRPGTTRHAEAIDLLLDGRPALRFVDTPGLEDPTGLLAELHALGLQRPPPERIRAFLDSPGAQAAYEQEAKVLRALLGADAALHVIDSREPVLPKYRNELEILSWCARPVMPVLNFVADGSSREAAWTQALADYGLHAVQRFDAVAPFAGAEHRLYAGLAVLLPAHEARLAEVQEQLALERLERRAASHGVVAQLLVAAAARRVTVRRSELQDPARRAALVEGLQAELRQRAAMAITALLEIHAFEPDEAQLALAPWLDGRWASDLFNPEALKQAGKALGTGALVGAGLGVAADLALAGLSLGTGAAIGAAVGGAASQGLGAPGRLLLNRLRGRIDLSIEDGVLALLAAQLLELVLRLEQRGHAATDTLCLQAGTPAQAPPLAKELQGLQAVLAPARAHPDWEGGSPIGAGGLARHEAVLAQTVALLRSVMPAPTGS